MRKFIKKITPILFVLFFIAIISYHHIEIRKIKLKIDNLNTELDFVICRMMDNSERLFYLEQEVGASYGQSGEY